MGFGQNIFDVPEGFILTWSPSPNTILDKKFSQGLREFRKV